jgi:polysaccharide biosynthesis protein PslH
MRPVTRLRPKLSNPRVLFLSCHLPWPAISGGRRRELELIRRLSRRFDIHLVVVSKTFAEDVSNAAVMRRFCREVEVFPATGPRELPAGREPWEPHQVSRHHSEAATGRVGEILAREHVDLIHVEGYYLMQHVPDWAQPPVLLVEQNVEYDLERQRLAAGGSAHRSAYLEYLRARAAEVATWTQATAVAAVTREDRELISTALGVDGTPRGYGDVLLLPDGADHLPNLRPVSGRRRVLRPAEPLVTLLANFAYSPNVDAALHLYHDILPFVREAVPEVQLWLVGNDPPPAVRALAGPHVRVSGRVPDVAPYLDAADVIACPLRIGGGIKVKAIEALRRGKALVSTSVGVQGLDGATRAAVAVADEPEAFAAQLVRLLRDEAARAELERRAERAATRLPTWADAAQSLAAAYDDLLVPHDVRKTSVVAGVPA